jgi:ornithine lipid ester-linked acyl 2-hydroxylase
MNQFTSKNPRYFYPTDHFPELKILEQHVEEIRTELLAVLNKLEHNDWLVAFPNYVHSMEPKAWKTFTFLFFQMQSDHHRALCPKIAALIDQLPEIISCEFSLMKPHTKILPHKGYSKMILRCHLPLIVPDSQQCGIRVGNEVHHWEEGKLVIFDDSFEHEAWNDNTSQRVVLMFDIPNPLWNYSAEEISRYKIEQLNEPFLLAMAPKEDWLKAYHAKKLPLVEPR